MYNHKYFMYFVVFMPVVNGTFWMLAMRYMEATCELDEKAGMFKTLFTYAHCSPWMVWMLVNSGLHTLWTVSCWPLVP